MSLGAASAQAQVRVQRDSANLILKQTEISAPEPAQTLTAARNGAATATVADDPPSSPNQPDYLYRTAHERSFGKFDQFGVAYDISVRVSVRARRMYLEDFDTPRELFNQLAYVRYGHKGVQGTPYLRVGVLDSSRLGYGQVLAWYDNTPSSVHPKRGAEGGMNFGAAGVEFVAGDITRLGVMGARSYAFPFAWSERPRLSRVQLGFTSAADFTPGAGYIGPAIPRTAEVHATSVNGLFARRPSLVGADVTVPLVVNADRELISYADLAHLKGGGSGGVLALQLTETIRHTRVVLKTEHRMVGDRYRPSFFDAGYEAERWSLGGAAGDSLRSVGTRYGAVMGSVSGGNAAYGEMRATTPRMMLWTFYQRVYNDSKSGWAHVEADSRTIIPRVIAHVWYDKWRIQGGNDLLKLDDRSAVQAALAGRIVRNMHLLVINRWTFAPVRDEHGTIMRYQTVRSGQRRLAFQMPF